MSERGKLEWEEIEGWPQRGYSAPVDVYRAAVPGGWLIGFGNYMGDGGLGGLTFVPDLQHTWKGGSVDRG